MNFAIKTVIALQLFYLKPLFIGVCAFALRQPVVRCWPCVNGKKAILISNFGWS